MVNVLASVRSLMLCDAIGAAALLLHAAWAEQPNRLLVLGVLFTSAGPGDPLVHAISKGLLEVGYVEGHDVRVEYRGAQGQVNRLPQLAEELVQLKVDFIIVATEAALVAAKRSTSTIPIIAALFD